MPDAKAAQVQGAGAADLEDAAKAARLRRIYLLGVPTRAFESSLFERIIQLPEPPEKLIQFRFPRSKNRRIRQKWAKNPNNWRKESSKHDWPKIVNFKDALLKGEFKNEKK